jgi:acyl-coenzyme A thioesterase PaaI-like protein
MLWKETLMLWGFTALKIPMILYLWPTVERLDGDAATIRIRLTRRSRNHLRCMYIGALCTGADVAAGAAALHTIHQSGVRIVPVFKNIKADFVRRAEADVHFTCPDVPAIRELIEAAARTGERQTTIIRVVATTPSLGGDDPVATFEMGLSVKSRPA